MIPTRPDQNRRPDRDPRRLPRALPRLIGVVRYVIDRPVAPTRAIRVHRHDDHEHLPVHRAAIDEIPRSIEPHATDRYLPFAPRTWVTLWGLVSWGDLIHRLFGQPYERIPGYRLGAHRAQLEPGLLLPPKYFGPGATLFAETPGPIDGLSRLDN